ncbi:TetR/AcrR family transcriptional regulator [Phocaeicola dorei]|nr:TetR/AcrR family transcriptional regulator [Phocaeicola dorei]
MEKVTVPELERVTKLQRGAIFYHFKDKNAIFEEVIERYFFSSLNIFYPMPPDRIYSLREYWNRKHQRLNTIQNWFRQESMSINPCAAFFHLAEQANLYIPTFKEDMQSLMKVEKEYWSRVAHWDSELKRTNDNACFWGKFGRMYF